jgi:TetR/AcrR family transcriptional regulator, repressor of fatR-cypB operon
MAERASARRIGVDTHEAILDAALALFVERGYHGTAVPAIAERAKVAAGTIYNHFTSKEELVNALFKKWKEQIAREVHAAFPQAAAPREQFRAIWNLMARFAKANPEAFAFLEFHHHGSYLDAANRALHRSLAQFGAMVVARAQAAGVIKPVDPMVLMELVFGAFNGLFRAHLEGRVFMDDATLAQAEQACWDAVKA